MTESNDMKPPETMSYDEQRVNAWVRGDAPYPGDSDVRKVIQWSIQWWEYHRNSGCDVLASSALDVARSVIESLEHHIRDGEPSGKGV